MRVAFAGTPEFARTALEALAAAGSELVLVLTQPDRPAGRGLNLKPSPVKSWALEAGVPVAQPRSLRLDGRYPADAVAAREALEIARPEVIVVAAYGLILPAWVLEWPPRGCLNIHASLLPRWRGAAPIHRAIEAGDAVTGITIMQMDAGLDTGAMLLSAQEPIEPTDSTGTLHDRLAALGGRLIVEALQRLERGQLEARAQPTGGVCYAHKVEKAEAQVDWAWPAALIERRLRAFDPFPGAVAQVGGEQLKLWRGVVVDVDAPPGSVLRADAEGIVVACGEGGLRLTELQRPGGRRQSAQALLQTRPLAPVAA